MRLYDYAASANCWKARALLAQLDIEHERVDIDIFAGDTLAEEFAALNPQRSTPVLELDDGRVLVESNAILWFLAAGTPLLPADPVEQAEVLRWLIYEQSDVMPAIGGLRFRLQTGRFAPDSAEAAARRADGVEVLALLDHHLVDRPFLTGETHTIADIAVYAYAHLAEEAGYDTAPYPHFRGWLQRVESQPGFADDLAPYPPNAAALAGQSIYG